MNLTILNAVYFATYGALKAAGVPAEDLYRLAMIAARAAAEAK